MDFPPLGILNFSTVELIIFFVLVIPTLYVMIAGAPFVPTQMKQVERMLKAANLKQGKKIYDLGSGDGRLVHKASTIYNADAVGFEYSPFVWGWSKILQPFWKSSAKLKYGNFWRADLSDADVIVCYLLPHSMRRIHRDIIPKLKKGTLIISHAFSIPDLKHHKKLPRNRDQKLGPVWIYKI